jgi:hypothetical protein
MTNQPERDPLFYWKQNNVQACRHCYKGMAIGANQCVRPEVRNVVITDHAKTDVITIEAADMDDLVKAIDVARKVRTL